MIQVIRSKDSAWHTYLAALVMILILEQIGVISLYFALLKVVLFWVVLEWPTNIFVLNLELYSDTNL